MSRPLATAFTAFIVVLAILIVGAFVLLSIGEQRGRDATATYAVQAKQTLDAQLAH